MDEKETRKEKRKAPWQVEAVLLNGPFPQVMCRFNGRLSSGPQDHTAFGGTAMMTVTVAAVTKGTDSLARADVAVAAEITAASKLPAGGDRHPGRDGVATVYSLTPSCQGNYSQLRWSSLVTHGHDSSTSGTQNTSITALPQVSHRLSWLSFLLKHPSLHWKAES